MAGYNAVDNESANVIARLIATGHKDGTDTSPDGLVHRLMRGGHMDTYMRFLLGMFEASVSMRGRWSRVAAFRKIVNNGME